MTHNKPRPAEHKFQWQMLAFALIVLPPIGLYFTVALGIAWATWLLMALIVSGMAVTILRA